jgi:hypothetical protein
MKYLMSLIEVPAEEAAGHRRWGGQPHKLLARGQRRTHKGPTGPKLIKKEIV